MSLGPEATKFLNAMSDSTRSTYQPGLTQLRDYLVTEEHYDPENAIRDFLRQIINDRRLEPLEQQFVDREVLKRFGKHLEKSAKAKSVRTYIGAVQALVKYYGFTVDTKYLGLPANIPATMKYPWELDTVAKFIRSFDNPFYQCVAVAVFQSGLGIADIRALDYDAIKLDFEAGVVPLCLDLFRIKT
jgi:hypothetical protein